MKTKTCEYEPKKGKRKDDKNMDDVDFYLIDLKSRFDKIKPNTYYLSYSGGKDSHFLYWFIKEYLKRDDIKIVGINTYMEHHQILARIKKNSDIVLIPKLKPMEIKEKYGSPCFSKIQDDFIDRYQSGCRSKSLMARINKEKWINRKGELANQKFGLNAKARELLLKGELHRVSPKCCYYLKKKTAHDFEKESGLKAILGVRGGESILRKQQYKSCFTKDKKFTPIHDLSDELMDQIYEKYNIEIPEVYQHIIRTGCMGCPYGHYKGDTEKELQLINESQFKFVCEYFKESYKVLGIKPYRQLALDLKEE
jgi:3'-phosphoadenosine 5'-phosphosulfate sulfotransferase (PAPS reductase)/FAD synthetase